jgi:hypothetical protein
MAVDRVETVLDAIEDLGGETFDIEGIRWIPIRGVLG